MKSRSWFALLFLGLFLSIATAQISPVATPFTGEETESFESSTSGVFTTCISPRVFNNTADLCTIGSAGAHVTSGWGFRCSIGPQQGGRLFGSAGGVAEYTFDQPVGRFGGYFGTNSWTTPTQGTVTVTFFDAGGAQIGSPQQANMGSSTCTWNWNGWSIGGTTGASRITVANSLWGGAYVQMDNMHYDVFQASGPPPVEVPASSTTSILITVILLGSSIAFFSSRSKA